MRPKRRDAVEVNIEKLTCTNYLAIQNHPKQISMFAQEMRQFGHSPGGLFCYFSGSTQGQKYIKHMEHGQFQYVCVQTGRFSSSGCQQLGDHGL